MRIAFMCYGGGSHSGVIPTDVYSRGVGGAELGLISCAETMVERGHEVWVYNDPRRRGRQNGIRFCDTVDFFADHQNGYALDAFVLFRTPWPGVQMMRCPTIFWSCDQQTAGNYAKDIFPFVSHTVTISPYHKDYFIARYGVNPKRVTPIDLGVRLQDYQEGVEKIPGRCIYCSMPERGLEILHRAWPMIQSAVPHATLVVTADRTLWGLSDPGDEHYRVMWEKAGGVTYLGNVPRGELVRHQLEADIMAYPGAYEEMFCIAAAECQVAGAIPVTSTMGALPTTVEEGVTIPYWPHSPEFLDSFVGNVVTLLKSEALRRKQDRARLTRARFDWHRIVGEWEELVDSLN